MSNKGDTRKLNPREARFAQEYVQDLNGKQAAIRAGYAPNSAAVTASKLLTKANVKAEVDRLLLCAMEAKIMSASETLAELSKVARSSFRGFTHVTPDGDPYLDLGKAGSDDLDAIAEMSIEDFTDGREVDDEGNTVKRDVRRVKVKQHNKIAALQTLAKYHGLLIDKTEVTVSENFADVMAKAMARAKGGSGGANDQGA